MAGRRPSGAGRNGSLEARGADRLLGFDDRLFRDTAKLEAEAVVLHVYATQAVPGLLQAEPYPRTVFAIWRPQLDEAVIEQRLAARLARQGSEAVRRGQPEQLLLIVEKRNVEIQVMPHGAPKGTGA